MRKFFLFTLSLLLTLFSFAQRSRIAGKISNNKNEGLAGVTIKISGGLTATIRSDVDGRFSFAAEFGKKYSISVSYIGYADKTIDDITLSGKNEEETLNIVLEESGKQLDAVTVKTSARTTARGETINALIAFQNDVFDVGQ